MPGICPRCQKNVYFAEEKQALGKSFHKMCFACGKSNIQQTCFSIFPLKMFFLLFCCLNGGFFLSMFVTCTTLTKNNAANCKKMLDSTNATEHDDELFCRSCYGKKFGPKGYGYGGGGAGVLSMDDGTGYIVQILTLSISFSSSFLY